jgi:hypothetical protein
MACLACGGRGHFGARQYDFYRSLSHPRVTALGFHPQRRSMMILTWWWRLQLSSPTRPTTNLARRPSRSGWTWLRPAAGSLQPAAPRCDPRGSPVIDLQLSGSSGQRASPHAQTNSLIVRPVLRSSRLCARCSAAPQRRQIGSLRPTDAVCGKALFAEVVKKPMASRPANDFDDGRSLDHPAMSGAQLNMRRGPRAIRDAPGRGLSATIPAEGER